MAENCKKKKRHNIHHHHHETTLTSPRETLKPSLCGHPEQESSSGIYPYPLLLYPHFVSTILSPGTTAIRCIGICSHCLEEMW